AVPLELERRGERGPGLALGWQVGSREGLAVALGQERLRVEGVNVTRPAVGEDVDDALGLRGEVGLSRRERVGDRLGSQRAGLVENSGEAEGPEPEAAAAEEVATSQWREWPIHDRFLIHKRKFIAQQ